MPRDLKTSFCYPNFLDWQRENRSFAFLATYRPTDFTLAGADVSEHVQGELISAEFFDTLGVKLRLGRTFRLDEDRPGATPVALVSEEYGAASRLSLRFVF